MGSLLLIQLPSLALCAKAGCDDKSRSVENRIFMKSSIVASPETELLSMIPFVFRNYNEKNTVRKRIPVAGENTDQPEPISILIQIPIL